MVKMIKTKHWLYFYLYFHIAVPLAFLFFSCTSNETALEEAPVITSASYQHTQYNGRGQPVEVIAAKDTSPPFIITYFRSEEDFERNRGGSAEPPAEVGDYYVRVQRPAGYSAGHRYRQGGDIKIEYHIQKAFISIIADPLQRFVYVGNPVEITAKTEVPVEPPLRISYFAEGSDTALPAPPTEKGRYRASLVFPGNERYLGASKEIELWIE